MKPVLDPRQDSVQADPAGNGSAQDAITGPRSSRVPLILKPAPASPKPRRATGADRSAWAVLAFSTLVGATALAWYYANDMVLNYGDGMAHMNIARRVFDSRTPGFGQLGTVWLPVPHLLLLPLVQIDVLWHTGLAGSIVGLASFVTTSLMVYLSARLLTGSIVAGWVGALIVMSNPNVLYMQATPMTEVVLLMTLSASGLFLLRWNREANYKDLIAAGIFALLAVGTRYDGWFFAVLSGGAVLVREYLASRDARRAEGYALAYLVLPVYGMFLWIFYNWVIFGNPLEFSQGEYSGFAIESRTHASALTAHNLVASALSYSSAALENTGVLLTALGVGGFIVFLLSRRPWHEAVIPLTLVASYPFNIASLYLGQNALIMPQSDQPGWYNSRYGMLVLPGVALFAAYLVGFLASKLRTPLVSLLAIALIGYYAFTWISAWPDSVVTVIEAEGRAEERAVIAPAVEYLRENYDGGGILIDDREPLFMSASHLPLREFVGSNTGWIWQRAIKSPETEVRWIVTYPPDHKDRVSAGLDDQRLGTLFTMEFDGNGYKVFRRRGF